MAKLLKVYLFVVFCLTLIVPSLAFAVLKKSDINIYKQAFEQANKGNWRTAIASAEKASNHNLLEVLHYLYYLAPNNAASFNEIHNFIERNPEFPSQSKLMLAAERALLKPNQQDDGAILNWFSKNPPALYEGRLAYLELLKKERSKNAEKIKTVAKKAYAQNKMSDEALRTFHAEYKSILSNEDYHERLKSRLLDDDVKGAKTALSLLMVEASKGKNDAKKLAEAVINMIEKKNSDEVIETFVKTKGNEVYFGKFYRQIKSYTNRLIAKGENKKAYMTMLRYDKYSLPYFHEVAWSLGWISLNFLKEYSLAEEHFLRLYSQVRTPVSKSKAAYWLATTKNLRGKEEEYLHWLSIASLDNTNFYGQLAEKELGRSDQTTYSHDDVLIEKKYFDFVRNHKLLKIAQELNQIGADSSLILSFLYPILYIKREVTHAQALMYIVKNNFKRDDLVVHLARRARMLGIINVKDSYPIIDKIPKSINQALVLGVIRQESSFDKQALSPKGAVGLMQVMPGTAKYVCNKSSDIKCKPKELHSAEYNITIGAAYLKQMLETFSGNEIVALSAYNAGPSNAKKWLELNGDLVNDKEIDEVAWIELIPFPETADYVKRVLESKHIYEIILKEKQAKTAEEKQKREKAKPSIYAPEKPKNNKAKG